MRSHTTSAGTTGLATRYSLAQIAFVTLAFSAAVAAGLLALTYTTAAVVFVAGGATAWVSTGVVARLRAVARGERSGRSDRAAFADEA